MGSVVDLAIAGAVVGALLIAWCVVELKDLRAIIAASVAFGLMLLLGYLGFWVCSIVTVALTFAVLIFFESPAAPAFVVCFIAGVVTFTLNHYGIFYPDAERMQRVAGFMYLVPAIGALLFAAAEENQKSVVYVPAPAPPPTPVEEMQRQSAFGDAGFARAVYVQHALADRSGYEVNAITFKD